MQLHTLGTLSLEGASFNQPKPLVLLSYLSLEGAKSRRHLAELFWPNGNCMKSLSMTVTRLRQGAGDVVEVDSKKVWGKLPSDAQTLLGLLDASDWERAGKRYTGAFLEGVVLDHWGVELEEWVYTTREYLAERVQHALLNLAETAAKEGDFKRARALAERAYRLSGLGSHDPAALKRLYPLLCAGNSLLAPTVRSEAESFDLKLELSHEAARASFRAVGEERLSPALPVRPNSFVGRDIELTDLANLLYKPEVALVTLVGAGGAGKTRLALQFARQEQRAGTFAGGVYFIPLDTLKHADLIAPRLLSHFGLKEDAGRAPLEQVIDFLAERHALLVLDNVEHLIEGAGMLSQLLTGCPKLKVLVTSRERLRLEEEHVFLLEGLSYPDAASEDAPISEAVRLFRDRAQQVQPRFALLPNLSDVVHICGLVEGSPLAIELAAGWIRLMTCADIAGEIEANLGFLTSTSQNTPDRHRSLRAVFDASWRRLNATEQEVLRKLSVFRGGFRREAASSVAGASIPVLASLVDKYLLRVLPNGRYARHSLLYQFTQEKLVERSSEEALARRDHATFYLELAERAESLLRSKEQITWFRRLVEEVDNFRAALSYLEEADSALSLRLAASLGGFWEIRGHYREDFSYLNALLHKTAGFTSVRAKVMLRAAHLAQRQGDHESAHALFEESLEVAQALDNIRLEAEALAGLGTIAMLHRGDYALAQSKLQAGLGLAQSCGDRALIAYLLRLLGALSNERADYLQAKTCYEESVRLYAGLEDAHNEAKSLLNLATVLTYLGDLERAHYLNASSLERFRTVGDRHGEGIALLNLGVDASERGDKREGVELYEQSLVLFRDLDDKRMVSHLLNNIAGIHQKLAEPRRALGLLEESLAIQRRIGDVSLISHALYILGQVLNDLGDRENAYHYYAECIQLCRKNDEKWALMRVLEVLARWHLEQGNSTAAKDAVEEALALARNAGDKKTLNKVLATKARLEASL